LVAGVQVAVGKAELLDLHLQSLIVGPQLGELSLKTLKLPGQIRDQPAHSLLGQEFGGSTRQRGHA
jgi:hypothetical protein